MDASRDRTCNILLCGFGRPRNVQKRSKFLQQWEVEKLRAPSHWEVDLECCWFRWSATAGTWMVRALSHSSHSSHSTKKRRHMKLRTLQQYLARDKNIARHRLVVFYGNAQGHRMDRLLGILVECMPYTSFAMYSGDKDMPGQNAIQSCFVGHARVSRLVGTRQMWYFACHSHSRCFSRRTDNERIEGRDIRPALMRASRQARCVASTSPAHQLLQHALWLVEIESFDPSIYFRRQLPRVLVLPGRERLLARLWNVRARSLYIHHREEDSVLLLAKHQDPRHRTRLLLKSFEQTLERRWEENSENDSQETQTETQPPTQTQIVLNPATMDTIARLRAHETSIQRAQNSMAERLRVTVGQTREQEEEEEEEE